MKHPRDWENYAHHYTVSNALRENHLLDFLSMPAQESVITAITDKMISYAAMSLSAHERGVAERVANMDQVGEYAADAMLDHPLAGLLNDAWANRVCEAVAQAYSKAIKEV